MKRLLIAIIMLLSLPMPAHGATTDIYLATAPNRSYLGELVNKDLESSLSPDGSLGKVIFQPAARPRRWIIDAALIEDIQSLSDNGSVLANNWLDRLKRILGTDEIYALAYGAPDVSYLRSLAPSELHFYYQVGQNHLSKLLNRPIQSEEGKGFARGRSKINSDVREFFTSVRQNFINMSTVVDEKELESDRARIAQLFNTQLSSEKRDALLRDYQSGESAVMSKLRIVSGRYRITSANQPLPITLVNDFSTAVKVDLLFTPLNPRLQFPEYRQITLNPKSKTQVSVPIQTIAAGDTTVIARFENGKGKQVGANGMIEITSSIISPTISRFTTGAGIILILAAVAQSVRRVRKARKS